MCIIPFCTDDSLVVLELCSGVEILDLFDLTCLSLVTSLINMKVVMMTFITHSSLACLSLFISLMMTTVAVMKFSTHSSQNRSS